MKAWEEWRTDGGSSERRPVEPVEPRAMAFLCKRCSPILIQRHCHLVRQTCIPLRAPNGEIMASRPFSSLTASSSGASEGISRQSRKVSVGATGDYAPSAPEMPQGVPERMGEAARKALSRATRAMTRYGRKDFRAGQTCIGALEEPMHDPCPAGTGWISFWVQLTLSVVSAVILLFSVAFTSQSGPR